MSARDLLKAGDRLGDYEIQGRLRAGGMATLYLGRRHGAAGVSKPVAIKLIHPHLAEEELIRHMFIDEARISSQISHANVIYMETFGEQDGLFFLVMEYVDGVSLDQLLLALQRKRVTLPPEVAAHIVIAVADGLHAAHETIGQDGAPLGIVHRDVSPSNVLITRDGRIKVIDFGIAKARGRLGETKSGASFKGKVRYMSPEQAWGRELDRRTDVYSLGIVLWELLTVRPLFKSDHELALLELVRDPIIEAPSRLAPGVPAALDAVVLRATAKQAEARPQSALELRRELVRAVPGALAVGTETIAELVSLVRDTLGVAEAEDRKQTTPMLPSDRKRADGTPMPLAQTPGLAIVAPPDTSLGGSVGEVLAKRRSGRAPVMLATAALFAIGAVAVAIALTVRHGDGGGGPAQPPEHPLAASPAAAPVAAPAPLPTTPPAPPPDAAVPAVAGKPDRPVHRTPTSVRVDGTVLAKEPDHGPGQKPAPKRPPATSVEADGTVLAP